MNRFYFFEISLQEPHTYYVTEHSILVHNAAFLAPAFAGSAVWAASIPQVAAIVGAFGLTKFVLKSLKSKQQSQNNMQTVPQPRHQAPYPSVPPDDPEDDRKKEPAPKKVESSSTEEGHEASTIKQLTEQVQKLDPTVGNMSVLKECVRIFKDVPGARGKEGPITKLLKNGILKHALGTARGAAYELEKAYALIKDGIEVLGFGAKYQFGSVIREFDIVLNDKLIECKNIDWSKANIIDIKRRTVERAKIAKEMGKKFELHSRQAMPEFMKSWFRSKNIPFVEG